MTTCPVITSTSDSPRKIPVPFMATVQVSSEDWAIRQDQVTHLRLLIKPDKRRMDLVAALPSLVLFWCNGHSKGWRDGQ